MTLADRLKKISATRNFMDQQQQIQDFEERVSGHIEEQLLMACLQAAKYGRTHILFERNCVPPEQLEPEGFFMKPDDSGYLYCWA